MEQNPLLFFNPPAAQKKRDRLSPAVMSGEFRKPDSTRQAARIFPKLDFLQHTFSQQIFLTPSPEGLMPEKVLVLDIAGNPGELADRLKRVEGFEFLTSMLTEKEYQHDDFYMLEDGERKPVNRTLYLSMSNQAGLQRLYGIWQRYQKDKTIDKGLTPLVKAFDQLLDVRFWDTRDRLESTHLLETWSERLADAEHGGDEDVPFEIELWYRRDAKLQRQAEMHIRDVIHHCGGRIDRAFLHDGIHYHALVGVLPISKVSDVIAGGAETLEIMRCDDVMFFRPLGQCYVPGIDLNDASMHALPVIPPVEEDELMGPVVALLDGLPLENHQALRGRIEVDDPDDFSALYERTAEQVHGTSMASLIIHGDLNNDREPPLERRLHIRPVMAPEGAVFGDRVREEHIPSAHLPVDLIHRAVKRMKKGESGESPTAADIVIINLSVGDRHRLFDKHMSPLARMLDWLSVTYGVLFVVSAGNHNPTLWLKGIQEKAFSNLTPDQLEKAALQSIMRQRPFRRMLSPAEAINALTVSATHEDGYAGQLPPRRIDPLLTRGLFSPANPITLGRRNMIKPEIMMPGGRQTYVNNTHLAHTDIKLTPSTASTIGPGIKTALPSSRPGDVNGYGYSAGTSNAAALATRRLAFLYESLQEMKHLGDASALSHAPDAVILKALMVHGAEHDETSCRVIERHFKNSANRQHFKSHLNQMFGYGRVNEMRIHGCFNNQATLIHTGVLSNDMSEDYSLPLPVCLSANTVNRRLIVTLAWLSPVRFDHQDYRGAQLWAAPPEDRLNVISPDYYHHYLRNGTVFHEVRQGKEASNFTDGDRLLIRVNCKLRAGLKKVKVPYAIVVTLDTPGNTLPVYQQVKHGLKVDAAQRILQQST